mgnify:CR=1 FL=1
MPIHLFWGDDAAARDRALHGLIEQVVDPSWSSINLSRLDGAETGQAAQALEEARTPPFGGGDRLILLQHNLQHQNQELASFWTNQDFLA